MASQLEEMLNEQNDDTSSRQPAPFWRRVRDYMDHREKWLTWNGKLFDDRSKMERYIATLHAEMEKTLGRLPKMFMRRRWWRYVRSQTKHQDDGWLVIATGDVCKRRLDAFRKVAVLEREYRRATNLPFASVGALQTWLSETQQTRVGAAT